MKILFSIVVHLFLAFPVLAAAPVWEVKTGDSVAYLGGTCHTLRASDFPLPAAFDFAYRQSTAIVFEVKLDELESREFQQKMMAELTYGDEGSLQDDLSSKAYRELADYCEKTGLDVAALDRMKPPLVMLALLSRELQKLGVTESGVDHFYYGRAKADGKRVEGLESAEEQLGFLAMLGKGLEDELVEQSLADLDKLGAVFEETIEAWTRGDEEGLYNYLTESTRKDYPELYQALFVDRNEKWMPRIEALLATPETELVLVGAGHLVGPDGLLEALKKKGYGVRQLE